MSIATPPYNVLQPSHYWNGYDSLRLYSSLPRSIATTYWTRSDTNHTRPVTQRTVNRTPISMAAFNSFHLFARYDFLSNSYMHLIPAFNHFVKQIRNIATPYSNTTFFWPIIRLKIEFYQKFSTLSQIDPHWNGNSKLITKLS